MVSIPLQRAWLDELQTEWARLNREYLSGRLKAPVIALDERSDRLGAWEALTRTIWMSARHLWRDTWAEVRLTLRHELAHQVVSELFGAPGAAPHGALFERACRLLALEHSPRLPSEPDSAAQKTLARVRKLLNLAQSSNAHEAQAAMATANRLLLKHNLARGDAEGRRAGYCYRWLGAPVGRIALELKLLSGVLQRHFFVQAIWLGTSRPRDAKPVSQLEVMGEPHNLDIAEYVHDYVLATLDRLWTTYRRGLASGTGRRVRHDYRVGVLLGFGEHLAAQEGSCAEEGLVWMGDTHLEELFAQRHPRSRPLKRGYYREGQANAAGREDGRRIRVRPGVSGRPAERGRLLE